MALLNSAINEEKNTKIKHVLNKGSKKSEHEELPELISRDEPHKKPANNQSVLLFVSVAGARILQSIYLPYIRNAGIFIPANGSYALGDQVFLLISLGEQRRKIPLCGTVVWITPNQSQENKRPGIGVRFVDAQSSARGQLERYLRNGKNQPGKSPENISHAVM